MRNGLPYKLLGCYFGLLLAGAILPGVMVESWPMYLVGAALLAALYFLARLITRAVTLAFDMLLLGLPRLFLEAAILYGISHWTPGGQIGGYWWAMLALLMGLAGMTIGGAIAEFRPPARAAG